VVSTSFTIHRLGAGARCHPPFESPSGAMRRGLWWDLPGWSRLEWHGVLSKNEGRWILAEPQVAARQEKTIKKTNTKQLKTDACFEGTQTLQLHIGSHWSFVLSCLTSIASCPPKFNKRGTLWYWKKTTDTVHCDENRWYIFDHIYIYIYLIISWPLLTFQWRIRWEVGGPSQVAPPTKERRSPWRCELQHKWLRS